MIEKVAQFVKKWEMLQKEDKVIVGVSGGADSVCLLFCFNGTAEEDWV